MKHHHTSISEYGNCIICSRPILNYWNDKEETNGHSDQFQERKDGNVHYTCLPNAKSLSQLNEERKSVQ